MRGRRIFRGDRAATFSQLFTPHGHSPATMFGRDVLAVAYHILEQQFMFGFFLKVYPHISELCIPLFW